MEKKKRNIFWQKYCDLKKDQTHKKFEESLKEKGFVMRTFRKHYESDIQDIQFKYLKTYGELLGLTWNDLEKEVQDTVN